MGCEVADRQRAAMLNTLPFKAHVGIHRVPFIGFKAIIGQYLAGRLDTFLALLLLCLLRFFSPFTGIHADQRPKVSQAKLTGFQRALQIRTWFALGVG